MSLIAYTSLHRGEVITFNRDAKINTAGSTSSGEISVTTVGMSLAIAEVNCAAQFAVANISIASAALLLQNVQTVEAVTPRMIKSSRDTNGKLKYLN